MTPEDRARRLVRVNMSGRLALVMPDGSLVDPMIGEPFASEYQAHVIAELRVAAPASPGGRTEPVDNA